VRVSVAPLVDVSDPRAGEDEDEDEDDETVEPFTPEELAEIAEAAADELLAVKAATTGR
jgi:hypothetical protein